MKKEISKIILVIMIMGVLFPIFSYANTEIRQETSKLIPITQEQIKDECVIQSSDTFIRKANILINEQNKVPQTPTEKLTEEQLKEIHNETWYPATKPELDQVSCYIDLKDTYQITHIAFKDTYGNPTVEFLQGSPFHWQSIFSQQMNTYLTWQCIPVEKVETRYLQIVSNSKDAGISEIAIYGYKTKDRENEETIEQKHETNMTIDKAIGANGFIDDRMSEIKAVGHIREYHNYRWVISQKGQNKFNPSDGWPWNFDEYYKTLHENKIDIIPCIQGTSKYLLDPDKVKNNDFTLNEKPLRYDLDPSKPESYADHASTMFQYAARYGNTKVAENKLQLANDQEKKTGLGYIEYYENNNEPDKNWEGLSSYASPYELAAMCSADYDGHEKTMGDTYGIKNADPNSKLVLGGLAGGNTEYLDLMKLWFENNRRDKKIAFDVINFHAYSGTNAPEQSEMKTKCEEIVQWRNENAPDKEVWITEFGWDTNTGSAIAAPDPETQGDWIVRGYLTALGTGIDRASMYMLRDASYAQNPGKYATSGLTTEKGAWTKKPSWYYVSTLKNVLTDYELIETQESETVYQYTFKKKDSNEICYALWCPTADGSKINQYSLNIGENKTKATLTKLQDGYYDGVKSRLKIQDSQVFVEVSESPIFVTVEGIEGNYLTPTNTKIPITVNQITTNNTENLMGQNHLKEENILKNFQNMFDEQENLPVGPEARYETTVQTKWENLWPYTIFPAEGEINLGKKYKITAIGFYDSTGVGDIKFYQGNPEKWDEKPSLVHTLNTYNSWRVVPVNMETQYIKMEKMDNAECYEIALYGYSLEENEQDPNEQLNHPTIPEEPDKPIIPEQPEEPILPEKPVEPDSPQEPNIPEEPQLPTVPEIPTEPIKPNLPDGTIDPEKNNVKTNQNKLTQISSEQNLAKTKLPKAGDNHLKEIIGIHGFIIVTSSIGYRIRRKTKAERRNE